LARPFLHVSKSQLIATLKKAKLGFADDPTNRDLNFTRPRIRTLMPVLAAEGGDTRNLARLASRLARANQAVEVLVDGAERYLALRDREASRPEPGAGAKAFKAKIFDSTTFDATTFGAKIFDAEAFVAMPEEIRLRLLKRAIDRFGHEGPAELGKVEALLEVVDRAVAESRRGRLPSLGQSSLGQSSLGQSSLGQSSPGQSRLKQTLAGALVSLIDGRIRVEPAPPRRSRVG
jgi:tRNA(Ile)-lysidine synthase